MLTNAVIVEISKQLTWDGAKSESTRTYSANEVTSMRLTVLDIENYTQLTPQDLHHT